MKGFLRYLVGVIPHPRLTFEALAKDASIRPAAALVLGYGTLSGSMFLISFLRGNWPPPPDELSVWVSAWGEFTQLPFLKIPAEQYRLFQAILMLPLVLAIWMLMAATARLLGTLLGGRASFDQYLKVLGFSFFTFWLLAHILDTAYNLLLGPYLVPAIQGEYGPLAGAFVRNFPPLLYVILFGLAGVYNGIAAQTAERQAGVSYAMWKPALVGLLTFAWPMVLVSALLR